MVNKILTSIVFLLCVPVVSMACPQVPGCSLTYSHVHQQVPPPQQQVVIVQQPAPTFDLIDTVESMVYISGGVSRIAGDYYSIKGMKHNDDYMGMWNKRYKYGLDTRARTGWGVRRGNGHGNGGYHGGSRTGSRYYVDHGVRYKPARGCGKQRGCW